MGRAREALDAIADISAIEPGHPKAYFYRGAMLRLLGRSRDAEAAAAFEVAASTAAHAFVAPPLSKPHPTARANTPMCRRRPPQRSLQGLSHGATIGMWALRSSHWTASRRRRTSSLCANRVCLAAGSLAGTKERAQRRCLPSCDMTSSSSRSCSNGAWVLADARGDTGTGVALRTLVLQATSPRSSASAWRPCFLAMRKRSCTLSDLCRRRGSSRSRWRAEGGKSGSSEGQAGGLGGGGVGSASEAGWGALLRMEADGVG